MCRLALAALLMAMMPAAAHASPISDVLTVPPTSDIWRHMLEVLFPGVGPLGGTATAGTTAFASAVGSFLAILMAAGTSVLIWHVISGTVATAHEGTVLGKNWHQVWAPIRVVMGVGLLVPIANGFCLAQVLVISIACWSGSVGNLLWSSYLTGLTTPGLSAPSLPATGALVRQFADAEVCHAGLSEKSVELGGNALPAVTAERSNLSSLGGVEVTTGNAWNALSSWATGGSSASSAQVNRTLVTWDYGPCGAISGPFALNAGGDASVTAFDTSRLSAIESLRSALNTAATTYVGVETSGPSTAASEPPAVAALVSAVTSAKSAFDSGLTSAASTLVAGANGGAESTFVTNAQAAGWVSAGSYYMTLARLQTRVQQVADTLPSITISENADAEYRPLLHELHAGPYAPITRFDAAYDAAAKSWSSSVPDLSAGVKAGADEHSSMSIFGLLNWLFSGVFQIVDTHFTGVSVSDTAGSGMQQLVDFGSKLLSAVTAVLGIGVVGILAAGGAGAAAGAVLGASGVAAYAVKIAVGVAVGVVGVGALHAYVLPVIPFVMWAFAVVSVLILVAEAMVAAPLWALMHVRMDGQELVGPAQHAGYLIIFNLFLRIPLTLMALFLSFGVFQAGLWLLSITFWPAALSATADTSAGMVGSLVMLLILSFVHWHLAMRSFGLITTLPDRVSRWFGAQAEPDSAQGADSVRSLSVTSIQAGARHAAPERPGRHHGPTGGEDTGRGGGTVTRVAGSDAGHGGGLVPLGESGSEGGGRIAGAERSEGVEPEAQTGPAEAGPGEHQLSPRFHPFE